MKTSTPLLLLLQDGSPSLNTLSVFMSLTLFLRVRLFSNELAHHGHSFGATGGQIFGASGSASLLPMNMQG